MFPCGTAATRTPATQVVDLSRAESGHAPDSACAELFRTNASHLLKRFWSSVGAKIFARTGSADCVAVPSIEGCGSQHCAQSKVVGVRPGRDQRLSERALRAIARGAGSHRGNPGFRRSDGSIARAAGCSGRRILRLTKSAHSTSTHHVRFVGLLKGQVAGDATQTPLVGVDAHLDHQAEIVGRIGVGDGDFVVDVP